MALTIQIFKLVDYVLAFIINLIDFYFFRQAKPFLRKIKMMGTIYICRLGTLASKVHTLI